MAQQVLQPQTYASPLMERPSTPPTIPAGSIAFQGPNGDWKFAKSIQEAGPLLQQGYQPTKQNGDRMQVEQFQGGVLLDGLPINSVLTGTMTEDQRQAMLAGGRQIPGNISIVAGTGGNVDTGGTEGTTGGTDSTTGGSIQPGTNPGITAPALPNDLQDALRQMMQEARDQGLRGQQALTGISQDYRNVLNSTQSGLEQTRNRQNELVNMLLGNPLNTGTSTGGYGGTHNVSGYRIPMRGPDGQMTSSDDVGTIDGLIAAGYKPLRADGSEATVEPFGGGNLIDGRPINAVITGRMTAEQSRALAAGGRPVAPDQVEQPQPPGLLSAIQSAFSTMNDATGLSPEAMLALRQQATEAPQRDYQSQIEQLKTQLGARGAAGGLNPADLNATLSGYAPLMTARDTSRQQLLANTILANEQRKFDTLGLNRNTAAQFGGIASGLTTGLANVYRPDAYLGAQDSALGGLLSTQNASNAAGLGGLNQAGQFAGTLGELQPGSLRNTLLSALLSTGVGALGNLLRPSDRTVTNTTNQVGEPWWESLANIGINAAGTLGGGGSRQPQLNDPWGYLAGAFGEGASQLGAPRGGSLII